MLLSLCPASGQTNAGSPLPLFSDAINLLRAGDIQRAYVVLSEYQPQCQGTNDIDSKPILASLKKILDARSAQDALWHSTNGAWFVEAECSVGFSFASPWRLRVYSGGAVEQMDGPPSLRTNDASRAWTQKSLPPLSSQQVDELKQMVEATHPATLTNNYSSHIQIGSSFHSVSDLGSISLATVSHGVTNRVCLCGPGWLLSLDGYPHKEDVRRFLRLWIKVLEMACFSSETINDYNSMLGH